jgi:hypothetical protein
MSVQREAPRSAKDVRSGDAVRNRQNGEEWLVVDSCPIAVDLQTPRGRVAMITRNDLMGMLARTPELEIVRGDSA